MAKILTVVGARPQFIKAAAVSRQLSKYGISELIVHTGQHFDDNMSDVFFREMEIPKPAYNLEINSLGHGAMTGRMMESLEKIMIGEKPSAVMVYGDTNSTLAGALVAKKLHIRVVHVEAGLRSFNMDMPEEINRILTDRISDLLFCPTDAAIRNLKSEGFDNFLSKIVKNGDVMQDAAYFYIEKARKISTVKAVHSIPDKFVLATIHRQENTDSIDNLRGIIDGLNHINKEISVVVPLHPRTRKILSSHNLSTEFMIIDPVGYFDMISLLDSCSLVVTDSGGVQKEAFFFKKQCVTMREQTEWVELVENGFNALCGSSSEKLYSSYKTMISRKSDFGIDLYGEGKASEVIARELSGWL